MLFARQSLQIIDENANASGFLYSETKSKNNRDYKEKERAYVTKKDEYENEMNISLDDEYYHEQNSELNYYDSFNNDQDQFEVETNFSMLTRIFICRKCKRTFSSNNQLHKHIRKNLCENFKLTDHVLITDKILNEFTTNLVMNISITSTKPETTDKIECGYCDYWYHFRAFDVHLIVADLNLVTVSDDRRVKFNLRADSWRSLSQNFVKRFFERTLSCCALIN